MLNSRSSSYLLLRTIRDLQLCEIREYFWMTSCKLLYAYILQLKKKCENTTTLADIYYHPIYYHSFFLLPPPSENPRKILPRGSIFEKSPTYAEFAKLPYVIDVKN